MTEFYACQNLIARTYTIAAFNSLIMSLIQRKIPMRKSFAALILIFWFQTLPDISITNFEIQRETQRESDCDGVNV